MGHAREGWAVRGWWRPVAALAAVAVLAGATQSPPASPPAPTAPTPDTRTSTTTPAQPAAEAAPFVETPCELLASPIFIGASATAGFGVIITDPETKKRSLPLPLSAAFAGVVTNRKSDTVYRNVGSSLFFLSPVLTGTAQIDRAVEMKPSLVVGIDYLFWFAYGDDNGKGGKIAAESERLEKLKLGFAQLERLGGEVPIVVGDLPNMSAAIGKMLSREQVPDPATLDSLNAAIREWAKARPNVIPFPLAELVTKLKSGETIVMSGMEFKREGGRLLQSDELHPTARGSIAMGLRVAELVQQHRTKSGLSACLTTASDERTAQARAHAAADAVLKAKAGPKDASGETSKTGTGNVRQPAPAVPAGSTH